MKKLIIQIILAGIIIFLGYKCYESIKIPQQFKVIKEQRYARIADRLKDIRTAQEAYKGVYGKYTGSFDTLINFIKYDSVKVVRSIVERRRPGKRNYRSSGYQRRADCS